VFVLRDPQGVELGRYENLYDRIGGLEGDRAGSTVCILTGVKPDGDAGVVLNSEVCAPAPALELSQAEKAQYESDSRRWCADGGLPPDEPDDAGLSATPYSTIQSRGCSQGPATPSFSLLGFGLAALAVLRKKRA
jgi:hypothetical protein